MSGLARRRLSNIVSLLGANVLGRVLALGYVVVVARGLGLEGFGQLVTVTAYLAIFGVLTDFGVTLLTVRDVARDPARSQRYLVHALVVRGCLGLAAYAGLLLLVGVSYPPPLPAYAAIGGLVLIPSALAGAFIAILTARERMELVATLSALIPLITLGLAWPVLGAGWGVAGLLWVLVLANLLQAGLAGFCVLGRVATLSGPIAWEEIGRLLRGAWPYGCFALLGMVYLRIATVVLSGLEGDAAVGLYNAAFKLVEALTVLPVALMGGLFPLMAAQAVEGADGPLADTYRHATRLLGWLAFPLAVGTTLLAAPIIEIFFGAAYAGAAPVLALLVWGLALLFLNAPVGHVIFSSNRVRAFLPWAALHTGGYVGLTVLLVAWYGVLGAAAAFLVAEASGLGLQLWFVRTILGRVPFLPALVARPALAAVVMGGAVGGLWVLEVSVFILVPLGALVYVATLVGLGEIRQEDRAQLLAWLARARPVPGGSVGV